MRRIISALALFVLAAAPAFAQAPAVTENKPAPVPAAASAVKAVESKAVKGKVESVSVADPQKGTKSEVVVSDENGQKSTFLVKSTTTIYDADWKATTLDKITKDAKIKVKYSVTKEGVNEALSLNVLK